MYFKAKKGLRWVCAGLFLLGSAALADPPQLTGPNGPDVQFLGGSRESVLLASERGLSIVVDGLADLAPAYDDGTGEVLIVLHDGTGGTYGAEFPARYAPDGGSYGLTAELPSNAFTDSFGYRLTRSDAVVETAVDGGAVVRARIGLSGPVLAIASGATLEAARAAVLADMALDGVRANITSVQTAAAAPTVTVAETSAAILTGRDTYQVTGVIFGPDVTAGGNLGLCATPITACEGGTTVTLGDNVDQFNSYVIQDLYISDTLTRVVTTVQNYFLNIFLAGADGTPHVGAQEVGVAAAEGFLSRMLAEVGKRETRAGGAAVTTSTKGVPLVVGPRAFAGFSGSVGQFDVPLASDWNAAQFTGGFAYDLSPEWVVGVAVEAGRWAWDGEDAQAEGGTRKLGVFGQYARGPWTVGVSAFAGVQDIRSTDAVGAMATYDATLRGAAVEAGYAVAMGDWNLNPAMALRWLDWRAPAVTDSLGGLIDAARVQQVRPELGLTARRSFATRRGVLDLDLEARVWTVTGDRTAVLAAGIPTEGPQVGGLGGRLGIGASWQVGQKTVLTARVERAFSEGGSDTTGSIGLRLRF